MAILPVLLGLGVFALPWQPLPCFHQHHSPLIPVSSRKLLFPISSPCSSSDCYVASFTFIASLNLYSCICNIRSLLLNRTLPCMIFSVYPAHCVRTACFFLLFSLHFYLEICYHPQLVHVNSVNLFRMSCNTRSTMLFNPTKNGNSVGGKLCCK